MLRGHLSFGFILCSIRIIMHVFVAFYFCPGSKGTSCGTHPGFGLSHFCRPAADAVRCGGCTSRILGIALAPAVSTLGLLRCGISCGLP